MIKSDPYRRMFSRNQVLLMQSAIVYCPRCGAANDPQMPYCVQCGTTLAINQSQSGSNTVVQNNSPIAPPPPPPTSYGAFPPVAPYPAPPPIYTQPVSLSSQKKRGINPLFIASVLVALVLIIGGIIFVVIRANTPTYPMLASMYAWNLHNNTVNITSIFTFTDVVEDAQGNISGNAHVGSPLAGSGPFKGSVSTDKSIQFTITPNDNAGVSSINCIGTVQADGSLSGTYTVSGTGETGTWQVK